MCNLKKNLFDKVNLIEHIYRGSTLIQNEHWLLEAGLPETPKSQCKIMAQLHQVSLLIFYNPS